MYSKRGAVNCSPFYLLNNTKNKDASLSDVYLLVSLHYLCYI